MTDEERANRNPAPEVVRTTREEIESNPRVTAAELELYHVYVLQSERYVTTWNYMGTRHVLNALTLETVLAHHFNAPRIRADVYLMAQPDGTFVDAVGTRLIVRRWMGPDA